MSTAAELGASIVIMSEEVVSDGDTPQVSERVQVSQCIIQHKGKGPRGTVCILYSCGLFTNIVVTKQDPQVAYSPYN